MAPTRPFEALLDHAQDKIVVVDDDGRVTYANDAVSRILGYDLDDFVGTNALEYVHPEDAADVRATFETVVDATEFTERTVTYRFAAADDTWVTFESRLSNPTDDDVDGYVVSSWDVTDRVTAERDRRQTRVRLEELAATTNDVLWMFSTDWTELQFVNAAYEDVYGSSIQTLYDDPASFLTTVHPDDVPHVEEAMAVLSTGESVNIEYRVDRSNGYGTWVWVQGEPIVEDGKVVSVAGYTRDVTQRRRRERQLYVMDTLLRHNLRNDLTVVLGEAERIATDHPNATDHTDVIRETAQSLLDSVQKGREIIERLSTDVTRHPVDVAAAVDHSVSDIRERFPHATVNHDHEHDGTAIARAIDGLDAAITELLENAIQHNDGPQPTATITVTGTRDSVTVTITDDATPIPTIEANVLTGNTHMDDVYHASGLGLWLVHWIVELANGTIDVHSNDDGNRIEVTFDRAA
jgi:PAS domain S-box-containing protein